MLNRRLGAALNPANKPQALCYVQEMRNILITTHPAFRAALLGFPALSGVWFTLYRGLVLPVDIGAGGRTAAGKNIPDKEPERLRMAVTAPADIFRDWTHNLFLRFAISPWIHVIRYRTPANKAMPTTTPQTAHASQLISV
jgi:hypothetical protein